MNLMHVKNEKPHVVIIGAGFGGLEAARGLKGAPVNITLLDRKNHHLFQPLLYQVATAALSAEDIAHSFRALLRGQRNVEFRQTEVEDIDLNNRRVTTRNGELNYDYLILAPGGETNYFALDSVSQHSFGLKSIDEAISIRNHILRMFEAAALEQDKDKRQSMLTFVLVGGGPTGVELAGALSELVYTVLAKDYPRLNFEEVRIMLLEASQNLLPALPENLREVTAEALRERKVEVCFGASVSGFDGQQVSLKSGEIISAQTLVWTAGVRASRLIEKLGVKLGSQIRAVVSSTLQLDGYPEVFVVGDAAHIEKNARPLPMTALVALQMGSKSASNIKCLLRSQRPKQFVFRDLGTLAIIGRHAAVGKIGKLEIQGILAWLIWSAVHIVRLAGFRNRVFVFWSWLWDYALSERSVRVITQE